MGRAESGGAGRFFVIVVVVLAIVGLAGAVLFLLSDINSRRYRLAVYEEELVVERGRFLPLGFEPYVPKAGPLERAYAPIPIPPNETVAESDVFEDRADVDRMLFSLLAGWAREALDSTNRTELRRATGYIERSELLPGLSEEQRVELRTLRADLAYRNGRFMLDDVLQMLADAKQEFELAVRLGTSRPTDAAERVADIEQRLAQFQPLQSSPTPAPTTTPAPSPPPADDTDALPQLTPPSEPPKEPPEEEKPPAKWRL